MDKPPTHLIDFPDDVQGIDTFLAAWENPNHPANKTEANFQKALNGKINNTGSTDSYAAPLLTRWHPQFESSLEPGIKPLVLWAVQTMNWITFSSCEGHLQEGKTKMNTRRISFLARNHEEFGTIFCICKDVVMRLRKHQDTTHIKLCVQAGNLKESNKLYPSVKLLFQKQPRATVERYFRHIESHTSETLKTLQRITALTENT